FGQLVCFESGHHGANRSVGMIQGVCEQRAWDGRAGGGIDQVTTVSQTRLNGRTVRIDVADEFLTDAYGLEVHAEDRRSAHTFGVAAVPTLDLIEDGLHLGV